MDWIEVGGAVSALLPVWTALITGGATLGAVWLTQSYANKREKTRLEEERRDRQVTDLRAQAVRVSELLLAEGLAYERISTESGDDEREFNKRYEAHLYGGALQEIGHAVAMLPDADARDQINSMLSNLSDAVVFPTEFGVPIWRLVVPLILNAASEVSDAYARGERPDVDKVRRYTELRDTSARVQAKLDAALARGLANLRKSGALPPK